MANAAPLRLVHTSDVHLGAYEGSGDPKWAERRDLIQDTFSRVIDVANESRADVLVIAGDFFDNGRVAESTVEFAARELARFDGQTLLLPGNHDPMDPGSLYWRHDFEGLVPRLHLFREHAGELFEVPGLPLVAWGRAYLDSDWHFKPLAGLPARVDGRWHVALAHGHFVREGGEMHRSLLITEAEVRTAADNWDYLALGHWEPHADISCGGMTAVYSGAPMPLSDANKRAGWVSIVDFGEEGVRWRLHRVDTRELDAGAK